ncbi:MAG: thioredoxin domain-containing protein [Gemmatimonadales bacterium]
MTIASASFVGKVQAASMVVIGICGALIVIALFRPPPKRAMPQELKEYNERTWASMTKGGSHLGQASAPHTMVVFTDYECAACQNYHLLLRGVESQLGDKLRIIVRHYPLRAIHPSSTGAAVAAACADVQGAFVAAHYALTNALEAQKALDLTAVADSARIKDKEAFRSCMASQQMTAALAEDIRLGDELGIRQLPAVYIDGQRSPFPPSAATIALRIAPKSAAK